MITINAEEYCVRVICEGELERGEVISWLKQTQTFLAQRSGPLNLVMDLRKLRPLTEDLLELFELAKKLFLSRGMKKSAYVYNNPLIAIQFFRITENARSSPDDCDELFVNIRSLAGLTDRELNQRLSDWLLHNQDIALAG